MDAPQSMLSHPRHPIPTGWAIAEVEPAQPRVVVRLQRRDDTKESSFPIRTIARQCYAWTMPYGVSFAEKTDVADGAVAPGVKHAIGGLTLVNILVAVFWN